MLRKFLDSAVVADSKLSDRQIRVIANTGRLDRAGDVVVASGCDLSNYLPNPIVLADHDATKPIGNFAPRISGGALVGVITFAPKGLSPKADEYCALYKAGVMNAVSIGFKPIERERIPDAGFRFTKWALMKLSCVGVPCDPGAVVIERALARKSGRVLNASNISAINNVMAELDKAADVHADALDMLEKKPIVIDVEPMLTDAGNGLAADRASVYPPALRRACPSSRAGSNSSTDEIAQAAPARP